MLVVGSSNYFRGLNGGPRRSAHPSAAEHNYTGAIIYARHARARAHAHAHAHAQPSQDSVVTGVTETANVKFQLTLQF